VSGSESAERLEEPTAGVAGAERDHPGTEPIGTTGSAAEGGTDPAASARSAAALLQPWGKEATLADLGGPRLGTRRGGEG
jgi:hypothetical protein